MKIVRPKSRQPLPDSAKIVFKGKVFDVYQWEQKMFDGSTAIFEKIKRPDTVVIFPVLTGNRIVLTKQVQPGKDPFIGAVGGSVESNENILDAAKREMLEETGFIADRYKLWKSIQPLSKIEWAVYIFVAFGVEKTNDLSLDPGEKISIIEVSFDDFLDTALDEKFAEKEIYRDVVEAKMSHQKHNELKEIFEII